MLPPFRTLYDELLLWGGEQRKTLSHEILDSSQSGPSFSFSTVSPCLFLLLQPFNYSRCTRLNVVVPLRFGLRYSSWSLLWPMP